LHVLKTSEKQTYVGNIYIQASGEQKIFFLHAVWKDYLGLVIKELLHVVWSTTFIKM